MFWWQILLYPFAILYDLATRFRNHLYNIGTQPSFDFETNVISVGNLSVGGTGKSPMIEYLVEYLIKKQYKVSVLSRGYGRKSKGFKVVSGDDDPRSAGDEPVQMYQKYRDKLLVAVGENRALSIPQILWKQQDNDIILLDDAFQHRLVDPSLSILLTTYQNPFYSDRVMPSGTLRESRFGARRADVIIMTKCPKDLSRSDRNTITEKFRKFNKHAPVFFTAIRYHRLSPLFEPMEMKDKVVLLAGVADPKGFFKDMSERFNVVKQIKYGDHHQYTERDVRKVINELDKHDAMLLCTEKDGVKLSAHQVLSTYCCYTVPYKPWFIADEKVFHDKLDLTIKSYQREY